MIPPAANAEFVYHLEDVLDVYTRPVDPRRPLVCLDEISKQLVGERRTRVDWAWVIKDLVDVQYPEADTIVLIMD